VARLLFDSISAGDGAGSPWDAALPVYETVADGEIVYALGLLGTASDADAVVATARFHALANGVPEVELLAAASTEPFLVTHLTVYPTGGQIIPELGDPAGLVISDVDYGDSNGDGTVNLIDYTAFETCQSGPDVAGSTIVHPPDIAPACICLDADGDRDVDLRDFGDFQEVFMGGPG
jgi:hypothetical protein